MASVNLSILIPACNEKDNIRQLSHELTEVLNVVGRTYEIIIVDDGSTDGTQDVIREISDLDARIKGIFFRRNAGQTAAFHAGFEHANGEIIITMDADLQNDPRDIPRMLTLIDQGYDFVTGWRKVRKDGFVLRTFPSLIANFIIRKVTGTKIHDLGCSLKVYRREITDELDLYGEMHRFIGVLVEGIGAKVGEIEVNHRPRIAGESKYNLSRTFKVLLDLLTVWFIQRFHSKPMYVFGGCGLVMGMVSFLLSLVVLFDKFAQDVAVHRNPIFLISIFLAVVGIQFLATGILAELLIRSHFRISGRPPYSIQKRIGFVRKDA